MTDHRDIVPGVREGESEVPYVVPNTGQARRIASEWGTGSDSALFWFAEDGRVDLGSIMKEVGQIQARFPEKGAPHYELLALLRFVAEVGDRGPTDDPKWHDYWDTAPAHRWRYMGDEWQGDERQADTDRCTHRAVKGTGEGACNRPLNRLGICDRPSDHLDG